MERFWFTQGVRRHGDGERFERMVRQRARIRFRKQGDLRLIGHRDLARLTERLFRRAGLRLSMSEGYHPKPRITFPSALALGIVGLDEIMEVEVAESYDPDDLRERLAIQAPRGLQIVSVTLLAPGSKKGGVRRMGYAFDVPENRRDSLIRRLSEFERADSWLVPRVGREGTVDLRASLSRAILESGVLRMCFRPVSGASAGPREALSAFGLIDLEREGNVITRTRVELNS